MESVELERAFEPFDTSKGRKGTARDLTVCNQMIEGHPDHMTPERAQG